MRKTVLINATTNKEAIRKEVQKMLRRIEHLPGIDGYAIVITKQQSGITAEDQPNQ